MAINTNILSQEQVMLLMGYERAGDAERKLRDQGITPFYGRRGRWFITLDQLNSARGIGKTDTAGNDDELL